MGAQLGTYTIYTGGGGQHLTLREQFYPNEYNLGINIYYILCMLKISDIFRQTYIYNLNHLRTHGQPRGWWGVELLRRKEVDRKLGGEPSGQGAGVGRGKQGEYQGERV